MTGSAGRKVVAASRIAFANVDSDAALLIEVAMADWDVRSPAKTRRTLGRSVRVILVPALLGHLRFSACISTSSRSRSWGVMYTYVPRRHWHPAGPGMK
jgi:hypothetical protein